MPNTRLRPLEREDLETLRDWRNAVIENMREYRYLNMEHQLKWWEIYSAQAFDRYPRNLMFGIVLEIPREDCRKCGGDGEITVPHEYDDGEYSREFHYEKCPCCGERLIGVCGWTNIDWLNRRAELSIYIGDRDMRGAGYGRAALRELHRIGFEEWNFESVWLEVHDWNTAAMKLYESEGYKKVGEWRRARVRNRKWFPTHIYDYTFADYFYEKRRRENEACKERAAQRIKAPAKSPDHLDEDDLAEIKQAIIAYRERHGIIDGGDFVIAMGDNDETTD